VAIGAWSPYGNGQKKFNKAALEAQQWLVAWIEGDPQIQALAEKLLNLLERTVRTSCAAETINSVLRPYFDRRRECTDLNSRQLFLNLFALWFNRLLAKVESWDLYPLIRANLH
jgi:hypothetical protein